jgi:3-hydroxyisobutyrate dehydrogenase-like beta-hydroxyacid dehydrogenase
MNNRKIEQRLDEHTRMLKELKECLDIIQESMKPKPRTRQAKDAVAKATEKDPEKATEKALVKVITE